MEQQRSKEWFEKRKHKVTGSQAGAILGLSPWKSREEVMQDWLYGSKFKGNAATEYGTFHEEYALADFEQSMGVKVEETGFHIHPELDWLGASPDGLVGDDAVVEIKCPFGKRDDLNPEFKPLAEQSHYYAQVQIEMACTGRNKCYFYQWNRHAAVCELVEFDQRWFDISKILLEDFIIEFEERKKETTSDEMICARFHELKEIFEIAKADLEQHKNLMIEKAAGQKRIFGDVSAYPVERKGSVPYAKVLKEHLPDLDLEPYRGEPTTSWVVK